MLTASLSFEMLMEYKKYRNTTPNPLGPVEWFKKFYPDSITTSPEQTLRSQTSHAPAS